MYTQEEVQKIVEGVIAKLKPYDMRLRKTFKDIPEYWPGYKQAIKNQRSIKIHAEVGEYPEELFSVHAPNETEKEAEYIKANYKQCTLPVFMDYISTMTRPFFDGNWSRDYQIDKWKDSYQGNTIKEYVEGEITSVGSIENFVKFIVSQTKAIDANGVIAVKPKHIPVVLEGEDLVVDNNELFEPLPYYYSVEKKLAFESKKFYLIKTDELSEVVYGGRKEKRGHVFEFYDDTNIWRITQVGALSDYRFEYQIFFEHGWAKVPVTELLGVPQIIDSKNMIWLSPFQYAVPSLNNVLISTQYMNASKDRTMFPYLVMVGRPCGFEYEDKDGNKSTCLGGKVYDSVKGLTIDCPHCHGSGQKDRVSPFGVLLLNPDSEFNKGDATLGQKAMYYVAPDPECLKFVRDCIKSDLDDARKILHQQTSNSIYKGTENLTATGMSLDTKAMYAFVKTPSDQMFYIWEFVVDAIGWMRYGEDYVKMILIPPVTFDYLTEEDYLIQLANAQKAGLPPFVIHSIIFRYLQTLYYDEKEKAEVFSLIISTDRLLTLSQADILLKQTRGTADDWEIVLHDSAITLIGELLTENQNYLQQAFIEKQTQLIDRAKQRALSIGNQLETSAVQRALGEGGVNSDSLGKIPLAMQQLALAATRMEELGDSQSAKRIRDKMDELITNI